MLAVGYLDGIRTHNRTGVKTKTTHTYEIRDGYIHIDDGPTGYESAGVGMIDRMKEDPEVTGWEACFGTPGRWDGLLITRESLLREFT